MPSGSDPLLLPGVVCWFSPGSPRTPGPALQLLDRLYASAVAQDRIGSLIEAGALRALALAVSMRGYVQPRLATAQR